MDTAKKFKGWEKPSVQYKRIVYKHCLACILLTYALPSMYFRVDFKIKKPFLCCCFTRIVFIELNFTVTFLLIRKTWDHRFVGKVAGWEIVRNGGGDPSNGGMILK